MENIKELLLSQYEYTEYEANATIEDIAQMDEECKSALDSFLNGGDISEFSYGEYSVVKLVIEFELNPISALLTISALKNDYENISQMLKKGIK